MAYGLFSWFGHAEWPAVGGLSGERGLCRQGDGSGLDQRGHEAGEDGQVHVQPHPGQATDPQRQHAPLMLEHTELTLYSDPGAVERLPPISGMWMRVCSRSALIHTLAG